MNKTAIWKAIKEPLRLLVLAIIPFVIAYFGPMSYGWAVILTAMLKFIDKLLHEVGKSTGSAALITGITRF